MPEAVVGLQQQVSFLLQVPDGAEVRKYYEKILQQTSEGLSVRLDSGGGKGKGLFTAQNMETEQTVLQETPLVAGQHAANKRLALVCSHCFQFLGSVRTQFAWCRLASLCSGTPSYDLQMLRALEGEVSPLPFSEQWQMPQPVACSAGCQDEVYCSQTCATASWDAHHSLLCCCAPSTRNKAEGSATASSSVSGDEASGSRAAAMRQFLEHADNTNDIFIVAAQVIANTLVRARAALSAGSEQNQQSHWEAVVNGWQPYRMGWKQTWWECVACPPDVDDQQAFRQELKALAQESLSLLQAAIYDERFPALFDLDVYGSIVGMFELNNLGIMSPSPICEYVEAVGDLPDTDRIPAQHVLKPLLAKLDVEPEQLCVEGTAFYAVQSCINHSCQPNAHAMRSDQDLNSSAVIIALQPILQGHEITISYIDEALSYEDRQEALQDYGFTCRCLLCQQQ